MTVCKECGTKLIEGEANCPSCGAQASSEAAAPNALSVNENVADENTAQQNTDARQAQLTNAQSQHADSRSTHGSSTTKAMVAAAVAIAAAVGLIIWQAKTGSARTLNLSSEDMTLIAESLPPQMRMSLASDDKQRRELSKNIVQVLALGEEARRAGLGQKPEIRSQLELARTFIIGQNYMQKQRESGVAADQIVSQAEAEAFLKEPGMSESFDEYIKQIEMMQGAAGIPDEDKQQIKDEWARYKVAERKAVAAGIDKDRKVQLQLQLNESKTLADAYLKENNKRFEATEEEVRSQVERARAQAEEVLKRARSGEDFEKLAKEFSDEPQASETGGDLDWVSRGRTVKEFEDAAFALSEGQISDIVQTQFGYHIIKVEGKRTETGIAGQPDEQVKARHILFMTNPQQVKMVLGQKKRDAFLKSLEERANVRVAEDYKVAAPQLPPHAGMFGDQIPPAGPEAELEPQAPPDAKQSPAGKPQSGTKKR